MALADFFRLAVEDEGLAGTSMDSLVFLLACLFVAAAFFGPRYRVKLTSCAKLTIKTIP